MPKPVSLHDLIPLKLAAQLVWQRVYQGKRPTSAREDSLNSIASTLSVLGAVYEYEPGGRGQCRLLGLNEIGNGFFKAGASELHFLDGRPPFRFLAVSADTVTDTITALEAQL